MIRQRSLTPRRRKATTSTPEREERSSSLQDSKGRGAPSPSLNGGVISFAEGVKERFLGFLTPTQESPLPAIVESSESGFEEGNLTGGTVPTSSPGSEIFVGAREFFAERQTRDCLNSDYFSLADTPSRLRESTRRLSIRKPFNQYIAYSSDEELDDWWNQPKSDYTYSTSLTYRDRVTPDRKIGSPNMSRRGLRGGNMSYMKSPDFSTSDSSIETDDSSRLNLRTRTILRPMDALSDTSDVEGEAVSEVEPVSRRTRSSRSRSADVIPRVNGSTLTRTVTSYTTTRTLHRGLDVDSDVDDGTESTVPQRATPFTARSGTPLARAPTPAGRRHSSSSVSRDVVGRGYTLAKGAIAEDVEEEEDTENDSMLSWRILSWRSVKRITTYVTTSVIMTVVRTVMAQESDATTSVSSKEKSSSFSFLSSIRSKTQQAMGAGTGLLTASKDHLRKRPVLIWIPLIPLLIFLALVASWWLLQSGAKTDDSADITQTTDGPSFLSYALTSASEITNLVISGICYGPILAWETIVGITGWLVSVSSVGLSALWSAVTSMVMWLGSMIHSGFTYILETIYFILELLQIMALAVTSFFTSSFSYVFGFILPANESQEADEAQPPSTSAWVSSTSLLTWVSQAYSGVSEAAQKTQTWIWDGWLWLVISVADVLTAGVSSLLWLLGFLWSLIWYMISGLWTVLVYIFTGTTGLLSSAVTTVTSVVVEVFSTVATVSKLMFLPFSKPSESLKKEDQTLSASNSVPVDASKVNVKGMSVEEIVNSVLESRKLQELIISISSENSAKSQAKRDEINVLVKSLVEGELNGHKAETAALWESHTKAAALETKTHMDSLKEQQTDFLTQFGLLEAEVTRLQDSMKASQDGQDNHLHHLEVLRTQINELTLQLRELENNHTNLASEVKNCCKNTSVTLPDVEKHVTTLLRDILGLSSGEGNGGGGGGGGSWSVKDMGAWLRSYFVAKEELESRLNILTSTLQKKSMEGNDMKESSMAATNAAIAQSTQTIMDTVLEKLRAEIHRQQEQFAESTSQEVSQQVNTQMQAAAAVLGKQVAEEVEHQLLLSNQQLKNSVSVAVEETIPKHVASAVSEAVTSAVSKAVAELVPNAVSAAVPAIVKEAVGTTVNAAVDIAIPEAVASAVTEAVNAAVPGVVTKIVADSVPKAIERTLPKTVNAAAQEAVAAEVQGAITASVSEVVASVLPAAVATAVNETVASRISEAVVDAKLRGGSDGNGEGLNGDGMVVVSGSHTQNMGSSSGATISATVNISRNGNNGSNLFAPVSIPMTGGLNESAVIRIVKEALLKYDADKTGMVDHALESAGGNIVSTRCTESYQVHQAELSILGFPIFWYPNNNNPRNIIQPERMPGQCWAFKGSQGYIVIKLAGTVMPTGFTIEHIPKSLSPTGEIDSSPREFEVWGLHSENDEGVFLGNYEYDQNGDPFQFFAIKEANAEYFPFIELKIKSNHGNLQYTCLYRFRVHGVRHL